MTIPAGASKGGAITIDNPTEYPKQIRAYLEDWYYLSTIEGTKEFQPAGTSELSCAKWISFFPAEFTIPPYGRQKINYTVKVPQETKGGHYAILFLETSGPPAAQEQGVNVGVLVRVGCLFYVEAEGTINRSAAIDNLNVAQNDGAGYQIRANFKNTGNTDITASGTFNIINEKGMVYARGKFNNVYTFPKDTAVLIANWKESLPAGRYDLILTFNLGKAIEEAGLGRGRLMTKEAEIEISPDKEAKILQDLR